MTSETEENPRLTRNILLALLAVILIAVGLVAAFGLPALGIIGLALSLLFFAVMLTFTAGN